LESLIFIRLIYKRKFIAAIRRTADEILGIAKLFPKAPDEHKPGRPMVPNGLGAVYILASVTYLFILQGLQIWNRLSALTLASCILFGGFMGLFDDWADLRWRYKAFLPIIAALPLMVLREGETTMSTYFWGKVDFGPLYYFVIAPLIVTITTNAVNQLGGLNGLESICPSIILTGLFTVSILHGREQAALLYVPLIVSWTLAYYNFRGKIFVGNTGSFSLGITLASYAIIANMEQTLAISIIPYIINSSLVLINILFFKRRANLEVNWPTLKAKHRRSLTTLIAYYYPATERKLVLLISSIFILSTVVAVLISIA
jgi:UDP-N-acetylglucosamine--dolichyl-phosphate N-acetylglucosaminephosphotransferase